MIYSKDLNIEDNPEEIAIKQKYKYCSYFDNIENGAAFFAASE